MYKRTEGSIGTSFYFKDIDESIPKAVAREGFEYSPLKDVLSFNENNLPKSHNFTAVSNLLSAFRRVHDVVTKICGAAIAGDIVEGHHLSWYFRDWYKRPYSIEPSNLSKFGAPYGPKFNEFRSVVRLFKHQFYKPEPGYSKLRILRALIDSGRMSVAGQEAFFNVIVRAATKQRNYVDMFWNDEKNEITETFFYEGNEHKIQLNYDRIGQAIHGLIVFESQLGHRGESPFSQELTNTLAMRRVTAGFAQSLEDSIEHLCSFYTENLIEADILTAILKSVDVSAYCHTGSVGVYSLAPGQLLSAPVSDQELAARIEEKYRPIYTAFKNKPADEWPGFKEESDAPPSAGFAVPPPVTVPKAESKPAPTKRASRRKKSSEPLPTLHSV